MIVIPAIDLKDGRCVRLRQGRAEDSTVYGEDPIEVARRWIEEGAQYLHVVDLDGAFQGHPVHREIIAGIVAAVSIPVEVGGGLRSDEDIRSIVDCGVARAIVGTRALTDREGLRSLVDMFGPRLAVGLDAREGRVQVRGWVETTDVGVQDLAREVDALGVETVIYTDTAKDGMLSGVNTEGVRTICSSVQCNVVASGGISSGDDVRALRELRKENLIGAIVGKALYEGSVSMRDLLTASG